MKELEAVTQDINKLNSKIYRAAKKGDIIAVEKAIQEGADIWSLGLAGAEINQNQDLIQFFQGLIHSNEVKAIKFLLN